MNTRLQLHALRFFVAALFSLGVFATPVHAATTYYVDSVSGSDSNAGTASSAPFKSISKATSLVRAGDTISLSGTFGTTTISKSGISGSPIYLRGNAKFAGITTAALTLSGSYLDVSGVEVTGGVSHGLLISGKNITVSNFSVHDNVLENKSGSSCVGSGGWGSGLKLMVGAENIMIKNGVIYNNCGEGFAVTRGIGVTVTGVTAYDNFSTNFYLDNSKNVTIERSFAYCTGNTNYYRSGAPATGFLIGEETYSGWGAQLENMTIINNVSYGCKGINFYGSEVNGGLKTALIAHNTIWKVYAGGKAINITAEPSNANIRIMNNIAAGTVSGGAGVTMSNNITTTTFATTPGLDPQSFKLAQGASAIDAGTSLGIATDFAGATRPQGKAPDIGAFEYGSATTPTASLSPSPLVSPSPVVKTGDANGDQSVDDQDFAIWYASYLKAVTGTQNGDFNNSGIVDGVDYVLWLINYGN